MSKTKIREIGAAIFALILVFLVLVIGTGVFGWNIPILSDLAQKIGMGG